VRAGHLWVVFAGAMRPPEVLEVPPALGDHLGPAERVEASGGTAIRLSLHRPLLIETRREDGTWRVRVSAEGQAPRLPHPLRLTSPARLRLEAGEPPRLVVLLDPETGEQLTVWPLLQADLGQIRQSLVELELLPTAQGLAWHVRSDRVRARILGKRWSSMRRAASPCPSHRAWGRALRPKLSGRPLRSPMLRHRRRPPRLPLQPRRLPLPLDREAA
jgi:hypothetical protein